MRRIALIAHAALCFVLFTTLTSINTSPASAQAGNITRDIKSFGAKGDGASDDHDAFQKAAAFFNARHGNGTLIISKGTYIVGRQIRGLNGSAFLGQDVFALKGCSHFRMQGAGNPEIKMRPGMKAGAFDPGTGKPFNSPAASYTDYSHLAAPGIIINIENCTGISLSGFRLNGGNEKVEKGGKFGDHGFQVPGIGVFIKNCSRLNIEAVQASYCVLDGIEVVNETPQKSSTPSQEISLLNCRCEWNGRQGLSWVGGVGLRATGCHFNHTGMGNIESAPGAGVDVEAEVGIIRDGIFKDCEFIDNFGCGFVADSGPSGGLSFTNCTFWGLNTWSMWTTKPNCTFQGCGFYGSIVQGYDAESDATATRFVQCSFEDKPYEGRAAYGTFLIEINGKRRMIFEHCTLTTHAKKLFWFDGLPGWKDEEKPILNECTLNIYPLPFHRPDYFANMSSLRWNSNHYNIYTSEAEYNRDYFITGGANQITGANTVKFYPGKTKQ